MGLQTAVSGDFPGGPVVKNLPCNAKDAGLISGQGTKIPHAMEQLSLCHNYWACAPQLGSLCATAKEHKMQRRSCMAEVRPNAANYVKKNSKQQGQCFSGSSALGRHKIHFYWSLSLRIPSGKPEGNILVEVQTRVDFPDPLILPLFCLTWWVQCKDFARHNCDPKLGRLISQN